MKINNGPSLIRALDYINNGSSLIRELDYK